MSALGGKLTGGSHTAECDTSHHYDCAVICSGRPMSQLEQSLAMQSLGDARVAVADPEYEANTGMFGGWTAALLLKAVMDHPASAGSASALTVNLS